MAAANAGLAAGVAGVTITPDRPMHLQGYERGPSTGTLDPLEARAIVFDDGSTRAGIVSADVIGLDTLSVQRIRAVAEKETGIPSDHIMATCSHTHSGPAVQTLGRLPVDEDYLHALEQQLGQAVARAARAMRPVTLGVGEGQVDLNVNRRRRTPDDTIMRANPGGAVDKRVRVLRIDPADASEAPGTLGGHPLPQVDPISVLFSYACHATTKGRENHRFSGDYPGAARRVIENVYRSSSAKTRGGTTALFLPGCFGNLRPDLLHPDGSFRGSTDHELTVLGRLLGSEVAQVAEHIVGEAVAEIAVARREVSLPYGPAPDRAALHAALGDPRRGPWAQTMLDQLDQEGSLPTADTAEVQVMRIGRHWLVTTPGETMLEIGQSIERGLADLHLAEPERGDMTLALGYTNGSVGYLCTASSMFEGGYEPATAYTGYLRPAPFAPQVETVLIDTALDLARELGPTRT